MRVNVAAPGNKRTYVHIEPEDIKDEETQRTRTGGELNFENDVRVLHTLELFKMHENKLDDPEVEEKIQFIYNYFVKYGDKYMERLRNMSYNLGASKNKIDQIYYHLRSKRWA